MPTTARTLPELLDRAAATYGDLPALEDGDVTLSFRELREHAHRAGRALIGLGIRPGDRVAIWAPNVWEWPVAALGIHCAGAVLVPINTRYKGPEARFILDKTGAKALITVDGFLGLDFLSMLGDPGMPAVVFRKDWDAFVEAAPDVELPLVRPDELSDILLPRARRGCPRAR